MDGAIKGRMGGQLNGRMGERICEGIVQGMCEGLVQCHKCAQNSKYSYYTMVIWYGYGAV